MDDPVVLSVGDVVDDVDTVALDEPDFETVDDVESVTLAVPVPVDVADVDDVAVAVQLTSTQILPAQRFDTQSAFKVHAAPSAYAKRRGGAATSPETNVREEAPPAGTPPAASNTNAAASAAAERTAYDAANDKNKTQRNAEHKGGGRIL